MAPASKLAAPSSSSWRLARRVAWLPALLLGAAPLHAATTIVPAPADSVAFGGSTLLVLPNGNIVVRDAEYAPGGVANAGAVHLYAPDGTRIATLAGDTASDGIGSGGIDVLASGDFVVKSPDWHSGAGAVTFVDADTGVDAAVSSSNSLVGGAPGDGASIALTPLDNGHYLVTWAAWNGNAGAVTWADGTAGTSGIVSSSNSLVGSTSGDLAGVTITQLTNGNYLVRAPGWDDGAATDVGAVAFGNGATGTAGTIDASNALVGAATAEGLGSTVVTLANGSYVVVSPNWQAGAGAATFGSGTAGVNGTVSAANSLVGSVAGDGSSLFVRALTNGNYVVAMPNWDNGGVANAGAAALGNGATGISGAVSAANALVGTTSNDMVGTAVTALTNGNYVVSMYGWDNGAAADAGAVAFGNGITGVTGAVSAANALVGGTAGDTVSIIAPIALPSGNYLVMSTAWDNGAVTSAGAVTWGNGTTGTVGVVSSANSLVGSSANDQIGGTGITVLANGNYVVRSASWDNGAILNAGAVTWGSGTAGVAGAVSTSNSLHGLIANDQIGGSGVTALSNGNYIVVSGNYRYPPSITSAGAVTWGNGQGGTVGGVSSANSMVGSHASDGAATITQLTNGSAVAVLTNWDNGSTANAGAAFWISGTGPTAGVIGASNALVGTRSSDFASSGVVTLPNGNFLLRTPNWDNGAAAANAGAVTWGSGTAGIVGAISASTSLVGSTSNDLVGATTNVTVLANGNYVVTNQNWDNGALSNVGFSAWGSGTAGVSGTVSSANALVGTKAGDSVGNGGATALTNGSYVIRSYAWSSDTTLVVGAVTWGNGASALTGDVSAANSLVGAYANDTLSGDGLIALPGGHYAISSPDADSASLTDPGALTIGLGTGTTVGAIGTANTIYGTAASSALFPNPYAGGTAPSTGPFVVVADVGNARLIIRTVDTSTSVQTDGTPIAFNATVTFTATVAGSEPGGTVTFKTGATDITGCVGVALTGTGDTRTAQCQTSTLAVATHSITAVYSGDANNPASTSAPLSQVVDPAAQTIAFGSAPTVVVDGTGTVSATGGASGNAVTFSSLTASTCSVTGDTVTGIAAGTCTIAANQAGNVSYAAAAQETQTFSIGQGSQTIAFGSAPTVVVGGTGSVSATGGASGNSVTFSSLTTSTCTVAGNTVSGVAAGPCTIAADQAGNANYGAAPQQTQGFSIGQGSQTIAFGSAPTVVVGGTGTVSATGGASGNAVTFSSLTPSTCTVAGNTVSGVAAGPCTIAANQAGNADYIAALQQTQGFSIGQGSQTITFNAPADRALGSAAFTVSATGGASGNPITFASQTTAVCTTSGTNGSTVTLITAGTCTLRASQAGSANYAAAPNVDVSFQVTSGAAGVQLQSSASPANEAASITLTATVTGVAPTGTVAFKDGGSDIAGCAAQSVSGTGNSRVATCATSALAAGTRTLTAAYSGDGNNASSTSAPLTQVINARPTITAPGSASTLEDAAAAPLTITVGDTETAVTALTVVATSSNQALFPDGVLAQGLSGTGATRMFTALPTPNAFGTATVTITVTDGGGASRSAQIAFTVTAVNDAPTAQYGADRELPAGTSGVQTAAGYAAAISAGPGESAQTVTFDVDVQYDKDGVLSSVALAPDGTLTYTLTGEPGAAAVRIVATDDGGTANGGVDTGTPHVLRIIVGEGVDFVLTVTRVQPNMESLPSAIAKGATLAHYRIDVLNRGPTAAQGARIQIMPPHALLDVLWTCTAPAGNCTPASGATQVDARVDIGVGQTASIDLSGTVDDSKGFVQLQAEATMTNETPVLLHYDDHQVLTEQAGSTGILLDGFE